MKKNRKTRLRPLRIAHQYYGYQPKLGKKLSKSSSYQDPFPPLSLVDETCKDRREETTTDERKAVDRDIGAPFVCEILKESEHVAEERLR